MKNKADKRRLVIKDPRSKKKSAFAIKKSDLKALKRYLQNKDHLEKSVKKSPLIYFGAPIRQPSA